jgi:glyoxylase I family protein
MSFKKSKLPGLEGMDHVGITVPDLDEAVAFYCTLLGAREIFRLGPFAAREFDLVDGKDWALAHVNVADGRFTLAMLEYAKGSRLELFQYDRPTDRPSAPPRNSDLGGHHIAFKVSDLDAVLAIAERVAKIPLDLLALNKRSAQRAMEVMGIRAGIRATAEIQALGFHQRSSMDYMGSFATKGVTAALSERDAKFSDYREA